MISTSRRLLVVKEASVHQIMMADELDPERTDISVPNVHQKLLAVGVNNSIVCRVLLQADVLFNHNLCPLHDAKSLLEESIQITEIIVKMKNVSDKLSGQINDIVDKLNDIQNRPRTTIPSVPLLHYEVTEYIRYMNAIRQPLFDILFTHFKVVHKGKDIWECIDDELSKNGDEKGEIFCAFIREIKSPLELARLLRNAIEHPKPNNKVTIKDFRLLPGNKLVKPTIEMVHPSASLSEMDLIEFLQATNDHFLEMCELFVVNTAQYFIDDKSTIKFAIGLPQPERRCYPETRFSYFVLLGNEWHPIS